MPIEIRELVIRANVAESAPEGAPTAAQLARLKAELRDECARLIKEQLHAAAER